MFALFSALSCFEELFPRTKQSASRTLLFPLPFGPIITLKSSPNNSSVYFPKLLKPSSTSFVIFVGFTSFFSTLARDIGTASIITLSSPFSTLEYLNVGIHLNVAFRLLCSMVQVTELDKLIIQTQEMIKLLNDNYIPEQVKFDKIDALFRQVI